MNASQIPASSKESIRVKLGKKKKEIIAKEKALADKLGEVAVAFAKEAAPAKPKFVVQKVDCGANNKAMNLGVQAFKKISPDTAIMLLSPVEDAVACMACVPKSVNKATGFSALAWIEEVLPLIGGKKGGKEMVAQTRGDTPSKTDEAIEVARAYASKTLGE